MMNVWKKIRGCYAFFIFGLFFLLLLPLFLIPIFFPKQHAWTGRLNRLWGHLIFLSAFIPYRLEIRGKYDPKRRYIFCANHTSYLDIPALGLCPLNGVYIGKNAMEKIPLFGWMYKRLHITVDRTRTRSRANSLQLALLAIDEGKNLLIFPEGGIRSTNIPNMATFKNGAFRVSLEKQVDIVPVSLINGWHVLPDDSIDLASGVLKMIFHEPISVAGKTIKDMNWLKQTVHDVIASEIEKEMKNQAK